MRIPQDVLGGALLIGVGAAFYAGSMRLRMGTLMSMGPGYFPRVLAVVLIGVGIAVIVMGLINRERLQTPELRPMLCVLGAVAIFALTVRQLGLIPAMFLGVLVAAGGDRTSRFSRAALLAAGAGIGAWLIFRVGLGLQLPGLRTPTWFR